MLINLENYLLISKEHFYHNPQKHHFNNLLANSENRIRYSSQHLEG